MIKSLKSWYFVIVDFSISMEVIQLPLPLISDFSSRVVQCTVTVHFVIKPIAVVFTAIDVVKSTQTISFLISDLPNVLCAWRVNYAPYLIISVIFRRFRVLTRYTFLELWQNVLLTFVLSLLIVLGIFFDQYLAFAIRYVWSHWFCQLASLVYSAQVI